MPSRTNNPGADLEWSGVITLLLQYWVSYVQVWISRLCKLSRDYTPLLASPGIKPGKASPLALYTRIQTTTLCAPSLVSPPLPLWPWSVLNPEGAHLCLKFDIRFGGTRNSETSLIYEFWRQEYLNSRTGIVIQILHAENVIFTNSVLETVNAVMALCSHVLCDINQWPYRHATLILKSKRNVAKFGSVLWQGCITKPFCRNCTDTNFICTDESWVNIRESF